MKTIKHSTKPKEISKASRRKELNSELSGSLLDKRYWPIPTDRLITLGEDLLLMFEEDKKMLSMLPWRQKHRLTYQDIDFYCEKCPELHNMIEEFKDRAGWRIFEQYLQRGDTTMAKSAMAMYNMMYRKSEEWRNNLKKELAEKQQATVFKIEIPEFPSSGKVPDKKESVEKI